MRALLSAATVLGLVAGLPVLLWIWRHNPLPGQFEPGRWLQLLADGYVHPDVLPNLLAIALWVTWSQVLVALLRAAWAQARRGTPASRSVLVAAPIQRMATFLIAAVALAISSTPVNAAPALTTLSTTLTGPAAHPGDQAAPGSDVPDRVQLAGASSSLSVASAADPRADPRIHVAEPFDTLRSLAAQHYGDAEQWTRIRDASVGLPQADGTVLPHGFVTVTAGTRLQIPAGPHTQSPNAKRHRPSTKAEHTGQADQTGQTGPGTSGSAHAGASSRALRPDQAGRTVDDGDTLWGIAEAHYPDAAARQLPAVVQSIADVNQGVSDGHGHHLHDPDRINPGMHLTLPEVPTRHPRPAASPPEASPPAVDQPQPSTDAPTPRAPSSGETSRTTTPAPGTPAPLAPQPPSTVPSQTSATPNPAPPATPGSSGATDQPAGGEEVPRPSPDQPALAELAAVWVAGAGFLAAGFLAVWRYRRRRRDGRVGLNQAVPPPDPTLLPLHTSLGVVDNPEGAARLQTALRHLATLHATTAAVPTPAKTAPGEERRPTAAPSDPSLPRTPLMQQTSEREASAPAPAPAFVSAPAPDGSVGPVVQAVMRYPDGDLEVFLREPVEQAVEPWQVSGHPRVWLLPADAQLHLPDWAGQMPHPNPALVQLGTTDDGAEVLVDLEAVGMLGLADQTTDPDGTDPDGTDPDGAHLDSAERASGGSSSEERAAADRYHPGLTSADTPAGPIVDEHAAGDAAGTAVTRAIASPNAALRGIARALTATLVSSPWADVPQIHTSGFDPFGLVEEERLRAHDSLDALLGQALTAAERTRQRLEAAAVTSTAALRATHPDQPADPVIVVAVDRALTVEAGHALAAAAGSGSRGLAVVLPASAIPDTPWNLTRIPGPPRAPDTVNSERAYIGRVDRVHGHDDTHHAEPAVPGAIEESGDRGPADLWRLEPLGVLLQPVWLAANELADLAALLAEASTPAVDIDLDSLTGPLSGPQSAAPPTTNDQPVVASANAEVEPHRLHAVSGGPETDAAGPITTDPTPSQPVGTRPIHSQPAQPEVAQPEVRQPEVTHLEVTHPGSSRPAEATATPTEASEPDVTHLAPRASENGRAQSQEASLERQETEEPTADDRVPVEAVDHVAVHQPEPAPPGAAAAQETGDSNGRATGASDDQPVSGEPFEPRPWQVMVRLLGPVGIIAADGTAATDVRDRALETLAWLVLHRGGSRGSLEAALWPTGARPATVSNALSRARAALEQLAGPQAHKWIPSYTTDLRLDAAVTTDLDELQARLSYAVRHRDRPELAIPVLRDGLALVGGVPAGYPWLDAELGSILTTTPTRAAMLLASLSLDVGDPDGALIATTIGLSVLPAHPGLFGLRMRARGAFGDRAAVRAEYEAYLRAENADPLADGETDRDLERLYVQLTQIQPRPPGDDVPRHNHRHATAPHPRGE